MFTLLTVASAAPTIARSVRHWIYQLGGLGFIPLGLLDNSVIPLPGSMDVLTIFLSARKEQLWFYYASMATAGSVIGGFVTYRLARKGGKETLTRRFPPRKLEKIYKIFGRWGLGAVAIPALLPPPVPMLPLLAFLAARYGRQILAFISPHSHPALFIVAGLIATVAAILFVVFVGERQKHSQD